MLKIVLDNDAATLAMGVVRYLSTTGADPFTPDTLIVGQLGTGIWLEQQLARANGVSANLLIDLPARFVWKRVEQTVRGTASRPPFDPMAVRWAILDAFDAYAGGGAQQSQPGMAGLERLMARWRNATDVDRMALATELAQTFGEYLAYRRHWIQGWADGRVAGPQAFGTDTQLASSDHAFATHEPWQRWLWQQVLERLEEIGSVHPFDEFKGLLMLRSSTGDAACAVAPDKKHRSSRDTAQGDLFASPDPRAPDQSYHAAQAPDSAGRIVLFGLLDVAPEQLEMIARLALRTEIIWFAPDPAQGFWEDLVSARQAARLASESPEAAWLYESEPTILGEWGRQQRDFLAALRRLEADGLAQISDHALRERDWPATNTALQALQNSVFCLSDDPWQQWLQAEGSVTCDAAWQEAPDASLEIHGAHSLLRQAELVHDRVLTALKEIPDLQADQIAIFCTDMAQAAPLVQAVFDNGTETALPVNITGLGADAQPEVKALQGFLLLVQANANLAGVLSWFEGQVPRQVCGLDDAGLAQLRELLHHSGVRIDDLADAVEVNASIKHGWRAGTDRLILGGFIGAQAQADCVLGDIMSVGHSDSAVSNALGHLLALLVEIRQLRVSAREKHSVADWSAAITRWCDRWLSPYRGAASDGLARVVEGIARVTDSTARLHASVRDRPVSFAVYTQALRSQLQHAAPPARTSGAITVAPLGSLRGVPFRVCVLLGMDQGKWPTKQPKPDFDLMRNAPQFGDPSLASEARGIFLDALLNTGMRLVITFTGRDDRNNEPLNPARVVMELMDYVNARAHVAGMPPDQVLLRVTEHPLQPFSPRRFVNNAYPSFSRAWFEAAQIITMDPRERVAVAAVSNLPVVAGGGSGAAGNAFSVPALPLPDTIRVDQLSDALLAPARTFLRQSGGIQIRDAARQTEVLEPLDSASADTFEQADLLAEVVQRLRNGSTPGAVRQWLHAHPLTPGGQPGKQQAGALLDSGQQIIRREFAILDELGVDTSAISAGAMRAPVTARISLGDEGQTLLTGQLDPIYWPGMDTPLQLIAPVEKISVRTVVRAWHQHLLLLASGLRNAEDGLTVCPLLTPPGRNRPNRIMFGAHSLHDGLQQILQQEIRRYLQTCAQPQALFPLTAGAWLEISDDLSGQYDDAPRAWLAAWEKYSRDDRRLPESQHPWPAALWRESAPPFELALKQSLAVYGPLWLAAFDLEAIGGSGEETHQ